MLLEFRMKNYKVFGEEVLFSMKKAPQDGYDLDYSILKKKQGRKTVEGLCSSVIYGPNAAGKTNLMRGIETFRNIVLRGKVKNIENGVKENVHSDLLALMPYCHCDKEEPICFFVEFIHEGKTIEYSLHFAVGKFMDLREEPKIIKEELKVNQTLIFQREEEFRWGEHCEIQMYCENKTSSLDEITNYVPLSLSETELFLTNGMKVLFSPTLVKTITQWFEIKLNIFCDSHKIETTPELPQIPKGQLCSNDLTSKAANSFGVYANEIGYFQKEDSTKLCSVFQRTKSVSVVPVEMYESLGTVRFLHIFPLIHSALQGGHTLILDEFDASIHPMAIMSLINVFHNDEINIHGAQLIFNTHNPIFLNENLFRRDEIKFVERDPETHGSTVYALSDFEKGADDDQRAGADYMGNYFIRQYGAIETIDFATLFLDFMKAEEGKETKEEDE